MQTTIPHGVRLTIDQAAAALARMGYREDRTRSRFDLRTRTSLVGLIHPDGSSSLATAEQLAELVYRGA